MCFQLKIAEEAQQQRSRYTNTGKRIGSAIGSEKKHIQGNCYCNRDFTVEEIKSLVKAIKGSETIWEGGLGNNGFEECKIDDKSFEGFTKELNNGFRKHGINKCIQKIAILAETSIETGFFTCSEELTSGYASSKYLYKGRGMIQLTGSKDKNENDVPAAYKSYKTQASIQEDIITHPNLVGEKLHLTIDSGCWFFSNYKRCPSWIHPITKRSEESEENFKKRQNAFKWKREYYGEAVSMRMYLSQIAELMEQDEEKYFFLISKLCHGYGVYETNEKPAFLNYDKRWSNFQKLKIWFKFDKNQCQSLIVKEGEYCSICNLQHIDCSNPVYWIKQAPSECWKACVSMLKNYGYDGGANTNPIIAVTQEGKKLIPKNCSESINYILDQLQKGKPIVVGVDDSLREATYNTDKTTEHFILIVGYGCENNKKFLRFFDPGSDTIDYGTNNKNRLYIDSNNIAQGKSPGGTKTYTLAQVRRNK